MRPPADLNDESYYSQSGSERPSILDAALLDNSVVPDIQFSAPTQQMPPSSSQSLRSVATQPCSVQNSQQEPIELRVHSAECALENLSRQVANLSKTVAQSGGLGPRPQTGHGGGQELIERRMYSAECTVESLSKQVSHFAKALDKVTQSTIANQEHGAKLLETIGAFHGQLSALEKLCWRTFEDLSSRATVIEENQTLLAHEVATGGAVSENVMTRFVAERMEANKATTALEQRTMMGFMKELMQELKAERAGRDGELSKIKRELLQGRPSSAASRATSADTSSKVIRFDNSVLSESPQQQPDSVHSLQARLAEIELDMQRLTADLAKPTFGPSIEELKNLRTGAASPPRGPPRGVLSSNGGDSDSHPMWRSNSPTGSLHSGAPRGPSSQTSRPVGASGRTTSPANSAHGSDGRIGLQPASQLLGARSPPQRVMEPQSGEASAVASPRPPRQSGVAASLQARVAYGPQGTGVHLRATGAESNRSLANSQSSWRSGPSVRAAASTAQAPQYASAAATGAVRQVPTQQRATPQSQVRLSV